ncbi:unnamed protein product, partial [Rotaria sp. Silwood2]
MWTPRRLQHEQCAMLASPPGTSTLVIVNVSVAG